MRAALPNRRAKAGRRSPCCESGLAIPETTETRWWLMTIALRLAQTHTQIREFEPAMTHYEKALALATAMDERYTALEVRWSMAYTATSQGDLARARQIAESVLVDERQAKRSFDHRADARIAGVDRAGRRRPRFGRGQTGRGVARGGRHSALGRGDPDQPADRRSGAGLPPGGLRPQRLDGPGVAAPRPRQPLAARLVAGAARVRQHRQPDRPNPRRRVGSARCTRR